MRRGVTGGFPGHVSCGERECESLDLDLDPDPDLRSYPGSCCSFCGQCESERDDLHTGMDSLAKEGNE